MVDEVKKLSEIPTASSLTGTEKVVIVQGGVTKVSTTADLADALAAGILDSRVNTAGDTMTGDLAMSGHKVTGLAASSSNGDAVRHEQIADLVPVREDLDAEILARIAADGVLLNKTSNFVIGEKKPIWDAVGDYGNARTLYMPRAVYGERAAANYGFTVTNTESSVMPGYCEIAIPADGVAHAVVYNPAGPSYVRYDFTASPLIPQSVFNSAFLVAVFWNDAVSGQHHLTDTSVDRTQLFVTPLRIIKDFGSQMGGGRAIYVANALHYEKGKTGLGANPVSNTAATERAGYVKFPIAEDGLVHAITYNSGAYQYHTYSPGLPIVDPAILRTGLLIAVIWGENICSQFEIGTPEDLPLVATDIALPPKLWLTSGANIPLNLHNASLVRQSSTQVEGSIASYASGKPGFNRGGPSITLEPALMGSSAQILISQKNRPTRRFGLTADVTVAPATSTGTRRILGIGDSLWNRYMATRLKDNLTAKGLTPTMMGSMTQVGGDLGEGREGRQWGEYIKKVTGATLNGPDMLPVNAGSEATYLALSDANKVNYNPFIRPSTGGDPSGFIYNGYIFDFSFYLSRFTYSAPTHVILPLGTNDVFLGADIATVVAQVKEGYDVMVSQIRTAVPSVKIAIACYILGRASGDAYWARQHRVIRELIAKVKATNHANVVFLPIYLHQSADTSWDLSGVASDSLTGVGEYNLADYIHFSDANRAVAAEVMASWVVAG